MSVQGNSAPVKGYDFSGVADRTRQMRAYDALPVTVRRALDDAPFEICCVATLAYYREHGARDTVKEVRDSGQIFVKAAGGMECSLIPSSSSSTRIASRGSGCLTQARKSLRLQRLAPTVPTVAEF